MNIQEWRKLGEALDWWDGEQGLRLQRGPWTIALGAAARRDYDRWQECGECDDGALGGCGKPDCDHAHTFMFCPTCGGSGLKPNQAQAQIDKLAQFIMDEIPGEPSQSESAVDTAIRLLAVRAFDKETE